MSESFIKQIFPTSDADRITVEGTMPVSGACTLALASRDGDAVTVHALTQGDALALSVAADAADLPDAGAGADAAAEASGAAAPQIFVVMALGAVTAEAIAAELAARADNPGPGEVPVGTTIRVASGAKTVRGGGPVLWSSVPPDSVVGHAVESSSLTKLTIVISRSVASLPSGAADDVTCSRDSYATVQQFSWTQSGSDYPVAKLIANTLEGLSGDIDLEWTRVGVTYNRTVGVTAYNPGGSGVNIHYNVIDLDSTADWSSGLLTVTSPA